MKIHYQSKYYYSRFSESYEKDGTFYQAEKKPSQVVLKPTLACNAGCLHCTPRSKRFDRKRVLTIDEYDHLIKELKALGTERICISGGEPLLYKNVVELTRLITENGLTASLNTNGWLLSDGMFKKLMDAGIACINLSIDSPSADLHDRLRNFPGLFQRATEQMKAHKESGIPFLLNVRMVLSRYNYASIGEMIRLALSLHADILSVDMIEADAENRLFLLSAEEIVNFKRNCVPALIKQLKDLEIEEHWRRFDIEQVRDMFNTDFNPVENFEKGIYWPDDRIVEKCDIPSSFMIVEGDGSVLPCNAVEYNRNKIIGNIFDQEISKLWNSSEWEAFRKKKMNYCRLCPMNMSYMLVFHDEAIERRTDSELFTTRSIEGLLKIDPNRSFPEERLDEYLKFFKMSRRTVEQLDARYPVGSMEYKVEFLYPTFFQEMGENKEIFDSYRQAAPYYSLRQLLGRPDKFEPQLHIFNFMHSVLSCNSRVLDYGCCVGDYSILFAKMGFQVSAVDLNNPTLNFAESRFAARELNVQVYRVQEDMLVPAISNTFDFVFCRDVLEHVVNPCAVLDFFYSHLNENGFLYISTMNPGDEIYVGGEHLEATIALAKTEEYKRFFERRFKSLNMRGLYKKRV